MNNSGGDNLTDELKDVLRLLKTEVGFLPKNTTVPCQPADSFIIQKVKTA